MDLQQMYTAVKANIDSLDLQKIWPGFTPVKFALYNDTLCFFDGEYIPKPDTFTANTAVLFHDEYVAIWFVMEEMDICVLTSKLVHEMFHAFQNINGWGDFPDEMEALTRYSYCVENLAIKAHENKLLCGLTEQFSQEAYEEVLSCRKYRSCMFPYEYQYESSVEAIEGSATYVEWMVLEQINPNVASLQLADLKSGLLNQQMLFPIRISQYASGALLILSQQLSGHPLNWMSPVKTLLVNTELRKISVETDTVSSLLAAYHSETDRIIQAALERNEPVLAGPAELRFVNIYDARYRNNYITTRYFLMYSVDRAEKILNGNFVIKLSDTGVIETVYSWPMQNKAL